MKGKLILILTSIIILSIFIFAPRVTEHAIFLNSSGAYSNFYVDGKPKKIRASLNLPQYSVVNFKHNLFKYYDFKKVGPISERVMLKDSNTYELEASGKKNLTKDVSYYILDKKNNLLPCSSNLLIVGKDNVKSFLDKKGLLKTFIISPTDYNNMRVCISSTGFTSHEFQKTTAKSMNSSELYSKIEKFSTTVPADSDINLEASGGKLKVSVNGTTKYFTDRIYLKGNAIYINTIVRGTPPFVPSYDGVLEFYPDKNGFLIINEVPLEDYLCKVVPSEMPISGGLEALKCQAVAARTYAISDMLQNRFAYLGFYVDDSTQSQVYNNTPVETLSTKAVNLTKGTILTYNSRPIDAKYYSTSAGTGVNARDIWFRSDGTADDTPYLVTHNYISGEPALPNNENEWLKFYKDTKIKAIDSISPYFRWNIVFSTQALNKTLSKSLKNIYENRKDYMTILVNGKTVKELPELKNIKDIKILQRSTGGNVKEISFIFDNVTVNVREDGNIRSALKSSKDYAGEVIPLNRYRFSPVTTGGSLPSSFFSIEKSGNNFTLYGGGYGHGVGMSQYGAMELSKKGIKYEDILNTYYKEVTLDKIY